MSKRTLLWFFLKNTVGNFFHDNGFFLAMGLAFNLLAVSYSPRPRLLISLLGYTFLGSERAMAEVNRWCGSFSPSPNKPLPTTSPQSSPTAAYWG